jgi:hypothetical protein
LKGPDPITGRFHARNWEAVGELRVLGEFMMKSPIAVLCGLFAVSASAFQSAPATAPSAEPRQLVAYLNAIGRAQLAGRARAMAQIRTQADAEKRKALVREKILRLIGGLPESHGALATRQFGVLPGDGFRVRQSRI